MCLAAISSTFYWPSLLLLTGTRGIQLLRAHVCRELSAKILRFTVKSRLGNWHLQIRRSKGWPDKGLRFILAGRELYEDDILEAAQAPVLHCMVLDGSVQSTMRRQHRPRATAEPVDWVRMLPCLHSLHSSLASRGMSM